MKSETPTFTFRFSKPSPCCTYTNRSIWPVSGFFSVNTAASGTAITFSADATGIFTLAVIPGRIRGSTFLSTMRAG